MLCFLTYTVKRRQLIENARPARATKFILNYPQHVTKVCRLVNQNQNLPLKFRRDISYLCLIFKFRYGAITTDVNNFINTRKLWYNLETIDENSYDLIMKRRQGYFRNSIFYQIS